MNAKLAGLALVIGSFLAPSNANAQYRATPLPSTNPPSVVQAYDTKIIIDDSKKKVFQNYLENRVKTAKRLSEILKVYYTAGRIDFNGIDPAELSKNVVYESALEAIASGDRNVYDMILKHTAWRNDVLIGLKKDLLKRNLDKKYEIAKTILDYTSMRFRYGVTSEKDAVSAKGTVEDLEFLYKIMDIEPPKEPIPNPASKPPIGQSILKPQAPFPELPSELPIPEPNSSQNPK